MRYKLIIAVLLLSINGVYAQVGINTENIASNLLLHIDPAQNNAIIGTPTILQITDDVVVDNQGNVGVGTLNPSVKLHIKTGGTAGAPNPQLRLQDGMEAEGRVLTSNADGVGIWRDYVPGSSLAVLDPSGVTIAVNESRYLNTKSVLTLPPGRWVVVITLLLESNITNNQGRVWIEATLGDESTLDVAQVAGNASADLVSVSHIAGLGWCDRKGLISGKLMINNTSSDERDYFLLVGNTGYSGTNFSTIFKNVGAQNENNMVYAFRTIL